MKKRISISWRFWLVFFLLVAAGVSFLAAESKNYYFPELKADIHICGDGSFEVDEYLTFEFRGQFSWASLWIPLRARKNLDLQVSIEDFRVRDENGRDLPVESTVEDGRFRARWRFSARNERRTFRITYRVRNGIINYPEISELYWQVIGSEVDRPTARAEIFVHLPGPVSRKEDLLVYGHGPLSGRAEIVDLKTVRFEASNIPARQFLEIRVVWPAGMVQGVPASGYTLEKIKEEEAAFVEETIRRVRQAQEREARQAEVLKKVGLLWTGWQIIGPLLWLLVYFHLWKRYGRDYRFDDIPEYFREMPSALPPALVQVLMREGEKPLPVAFTATIFDLATRGYLAIGEEQIEKKTLSGTKAKKQTVFQLKKDYKTDPSLRDWEKQTLDYLFARAGCEVSSVQRITLDNLVDYIKKHPAEYQSWFRKWQEEVFKEGKKLGFVEPRSWRLSRIFLAVSLVVAVLTLSPVLFVMSLVLCPKLKRRHKDWARENELWKALERFLDDFSEFSEIPPEAYRLWEKYLVFAILFGKAKKLIRMLPGVLKSDQAAPAVWVAGIQGAAVAGRQVDSISAAISSIERAASALNQASARAAAYSSGGGGGFSGGGGGGGGGGGVSAG
ncbi:MAG: DUF2207 domain-containing protein [Candidatus Saccharicenans sp.]